MNLHAIIAPVISAINPWQRATMLRSSGYTTNADGSRAPVYAAAASMLVQVQELTSHDLQQLDGLNLQTETKAIYLNGNWEGVIRVDGRGGDLIQVGGRVFLVTKVLENWGGQKGWTKLAVTLQLDAPRLA